MEYETLLWEVDEDGIGVLTLNRPDRLNAFTVKMTEELLEFLETADADDSVRAIIVTGAGRGFCAGMDLEGDEVQGDNVFGLPEDVDPYGPDAEKIRDLGGTVTLRLYRMKKPVIAAMNGVGVGIGATMTLPMDARIMSDKAKVGFVFSKIGICMEACSSWFLPRLIGMQNALDWTMSGEIQSAEAAKSAGFAAEVVPHEELLDAAKARARRYVKGTAAVSVAVNRNLIWRMAGARHPIEAHRADSRAMLDLSMGDGKEGVASFREKRAPEFAAKPSSDMPRGLDWDLAPPFMED
ncbi:enoyl-CoA hydratase-related protein [Rhodovulum sp. DZ06]|uniref:enoyl-CoA hydratase-related protein n=1 Tax=Rhodovulum sp. DZ06 TaxID=3425126 RepID=UPI003D34A186